MNLTELTDSKVRELVKQFTDETRDYIEELHLTSPLHPEKNPANHDAAVMLQSEYRDSLAESRFSSSVIRQAQELLAAAGITVISESLEFKKLCREITRAQQQLNCYALSLAKGADTVSDTNYLSSPQSQVTTPELPSVTVSAEYSKEKAASGDWGSERTSASFKQAVAIFLELMGDMDITKLDKKAARDFKDRLLKYPKGRNKLKALKDLSIQAIMEGEAEYKCISRTTASNRWGMIVSILNMAQSVGHITNNPLSDMPIKVSMIRKRSVSLLLVVMLRPSSITESLLRVRGCVTITTGYR